MNGVRYVLLLAGLLPLAGCTARPDAEPILIGHVAALTGAGKARGEHARQGIRLAVEEANAAAGLVAGRRVVVDHADTRDDPESARAVIRRLLTVNRVAAVLGGPEAGRVENVGALAQSAGVPFVLSGGQPARPAAEFVFYTGPTPARQGQALARYAGQELKAAVVAVLTDGSRPAAVEAFTRASAKPPAGSWTYKGSDQLKPAVQEILAKKPDAILFAGPADELARLGSAGLTEKIPVLFAGEDGALAKLEAARCPAPVYLVTAFAGEGLASAQAFVEKYQERFQDAPDAAAALAYDDARLLFAAIREAGSIDGAKVRDALAAVRFEGLTGPLTFDKDHAAVRTLFVVRVKDGKAKTVRRYGAEAEAAAGHAAPAVLADLQAAR